MLTDTGVPSHGGVSDFPLARDFAMGLDRRGGGSMISPWYVTVSVAAGAAVLLGAGTSSAQDAMVYRWVDDEGGVHFTQGRESIPAAYRAGAVPLGSVGGVQSPGAEPGQAEPAAEPPAPATPPAPARPEAQRPPPPPPPPPPPNAPERLALDELLEKARTTDQYLVIGEAYLRLGLPLAAKTCASKAAAAAVSSRDWDRVAGAYGALGDTQASSEARQRSERLRQEERVIENIIRPR